jgi:hypothetical protein
MDGVAESARSAMERKEEVGEDADDMFMVGMVKCRSCRCRTVLFWR